MTSREATVLQPGSVSFHLSLAGAWTAAMLQRLDVSRTATSALVPETFDAFGVAMAAVLAFYVALFEDLHLRAVRFRDALMHFGEKAKRDFDFGPVPAKPPGPSDIRRVVSRGAVVMAFGFEHGEAYLFAPIDKNTARRGWSRLSWADMEWAARAIQAWTLDLLGRWGEIEQRWAPYVEAHGHRLVTPSASPSDRRVRRG